MELADKQDWEVKTLPVWQPGDVILDTYEVEDVISGGMGHVYIAHHKNWKVKLAIKSPNEMMLSDRDFFARVLREANSWTELGLHPNIAYCYYVRNIEDVPHIFVEYVDGGNLRQWIEEGRCIDYRTSLDLAIQFCHGMEYAHSKGMIHRDIKPENVLMTSDGILKITDFGLVRDHETGAEDRSPGFSDQVSDTKDHKEGSLTTIGTFMGTQGYMAPEQAEDPHGVDVRADIFSFGVCLYEMFCGNKPYKMTGGPKQAPPDPIELGGDENFPVDLAEVLNKCTQWDRDARPISFEKIRKKLLLIYTGLLGEGSDYAELENIGIEANGLNNQGVSFFELGRKEAAITCWNKALKQDQVHLEATYNLALINWRDGKIGDDEVLRALDNCKNKPNVDLKILAELKADINYERLDIEAAKDILKEFEGRFNSLFDFRDKTQIKLIHNDSGHQAPIIDIAYSPDRKFALTGSTDKTMRLWDVNSNQCLNIFSGHTDSISSVCFFKRGQLGLSGSFDKVINLWDLESGQCIETMEGHTEGIKSIAVVEDKSLALSGSHDNTLKLWDLNNGQCLRTFGGLTNPVSSIAIAPDGRLAISGDGGMPGPNRENAVRVWDVENGRCLLVLDEHDGVIHSVDMSSDGKLAVSGSADKTIRLWDLEQGICIKILEGHANNVNSVSLDPNYKYLMSGSYDRTVKLWELKTGRCLRTIQGMADYIHVYLNLDQDIALSGGSDTKLTIWSFPGNLSRDSSLHISSAKDYNKLKHVAKIIDQDLIKAIAFYETGNYLKSYETLIKVWESCHFKHDNRIQGLYEKLNYRGTKKKLIFANQIKTLKGHEGTIYSIALIKEEGLVVSGGFDQKLKLWELENGQCVRTIKGHTGTISSVTALSGGKLALSGGYDGTLRLWDLDTGLCINIMSRDNEKINSIAVIEGEQIVIAGYDTGAIRFWEIETGRCMNTIWSEGNIRVLTAIDGGKTLISGHTRLPGQGSGVNIRLWDIKTKSCISEIGDSHVSAGALTIDEKRKLIISGSYYQAIKLWSLKDGKHIRALDEPYTNNVNSLSVISNSKFVLAACQKPIIKIFNYVTGEHITTLQGHSESVNAVAIDKEGLLLLSGGSDKTIRVWRLAWDFEFDDKKE